MFYSFPRELTLLADSEINCFELRVYRGMLIHVNDCRSTVIITFWSFSVSERIFQVILKWKNTVLWYSVTSGRGLGLMTKTTVNPWLGKLEFFFRVNDGKKDVERLIWIYDEKSCCNKATGRIWNAIWYKWLLLVLSDLSQSLLRIPGKVEQNSTSHMINFS